MVVRGCSVHVCWCCDEGGNCLFQHGKCLKEMGSLKLILERNLHEDFCRAGVSHYD